MSFNKDLEHLGDSQQKDWRPFDKIIFADATNDRYGFAANNWNGTNIYNYFAPNKPFSYSMWWGLNNLSSFVGLSANYFSSSPSGVQDYYISGIGMSFGFANWTATYLGSLPFSTYHTVCTYDGSGNSNGVKLYINSIDFDKLGLVTRRTAIVPSLPYVANFFQYQIDNGAFFSGNLCDFRFFDNQILTSEEVRKLYHGNWETNLGGRTELIRLPMTLSSHYANNTPALLCSALDISGNNNHLIISGQGTTPTLNNFY